MLFKEITGHNEIKNRLINGINSGRFGHAQLFAGPEGNGALALAIAYAQYVNCKGEKTDDACGTCSSCVKYNKLVHPDLHFIFPHQSYKSGSREKERNALLIKWRSIMSDNPYISENSWYSFIGMENKQGLINKDDSVDIIKALSMKSFEAEYKVMIIWMPERMNDTAANKILKLLEEPPQKTLFLLVTNSPDRIIKTITSRTQITKIPAIRRDDIVGALINRYGVDSETSEEIAKYSNGNFAKAIDAKNNWGQEDEHLDHFRNLLRYCWGRKIIEISTWVEDTATRGREDIKQLLLRGSQIIRENIMQTVDCDEISFTTPYEKAFIEKFHVFVKPENIGDAYDILNQAYIDIARNANVKIVLTDMSFKLATLFFPRNKG
ncbi:MAG: DNA polymerase III subunit delta [Bacteroidales bacterium]|jgi:DNA polymerase-3 subunit delta'|nr:DNA polymerase III subunit delta [Bacteroidales bacterium]